MRHHNIIGVTVLYSLIATHIDELDRILGGGIPRPGLTMILGHTGTGKTTLASQIIVNRAIRDGEKGAIVTLIENEKALVERLSGLGFPIKELLEKKLLEIYSLMPTGPSSEVARHAMEFLTSITVGGEVRNIIVDSITAITELLSPEFGRTLTSILYKKAYEGNVSIIAIGEEPIVSGAYRLMFQEFIPDALIILRHVFRRDEFIIVMKVLKVRGAMHSRAYHQVTVSSKGFEILGSTTLSGV